MSKREIFKRKSEKGGEEMYANKRDDGDGFEREEIVQEGETRVRAGVRDLICGDEVIEEDLPAFTDVTWLAGERGRKQRGTKDSRGGKDGVPVEGGIGAVDGFDSVVVCGRSALGRLAIMCLEGDVNMFVNACGIEVESSEPPDFIDDVVEKVKLEGV